MAGRLGILKGTKYLTLNLWFTRLDFTLGFSFRLPTKYVYFETSDGYFWDIYGYHKSWIDNKDKEWARTCRDYFAIGPFSSLEECKKQARDFFIEDHKAKVTWIRIDDPQYPFPPRPRFPSIG